MEAAGIDTEHVDLGHVRPDDVGQHHRLGSEAVRVNDAAMLAHCGGQLFPDRGGLLFELEGQQFSHNAGDYSHAHPVD